MHTLELVGDQQLSVERRGSNDVIVVAGSEGEISFSITVTPEGHVLQFEGAGLLIQTSGSMRIEAEEVRIHGREKLALTSGGDLDIRAAGDVQSGARIQNITAYLGNVNIKANDDVKMDGERIRMNC